ncbi:hypothetical protein TrVGV298_001857 [Trichoderma virens]|nr:hypothetical protein TrVGV298_001857 [Trichoderma virens]
MKTAAFALLAAASVEQVAATYSLGSSWTNAKPYSCPGNTNNNCNTQQHNGWDFSDVPTGVIGHYGGFDFSGWSCENDFSKRDSLLSARTFGATGRSISGKCTGDKNTTPCISASAGNDHFSVDTFSVSVEFDTRMEFHYEMPDGSTCKHSAQCSSQGTSVKNTQCGGAKKVWIVYPGGGNGGKKSTCGTKVHHISWDCGNNAPPSKPTQPVYTPPGGGHHTKPSYSQPVYTPPGGGHHTKSHTKPGYTPPAGETTTAPVDTYTAPAVTTTAPGETYTAPAGETTTGPAGAETTTAPGETYTAPAGETTTGPAGAETTTAPGETYTAPAGETTTGPAGAETTTAPAGAETTTAPAGETTTAPAGAETTTAPYGGVPTNTATTDVVVSTSVITAPGGETTAPAGETTTGPAGAETTTAPAGETTTAPAGAETTTAPAGETTTAPAGQTYPVPGETTTAPAGAETTAPATTGGSDAVTTGPGAPYTTVYQTTSTVFTTSVHTITSCAPEVTNCPARTDKPVVTTVTVAVSTTICPVTATITPGVPLPTSEAAAPTGSGSSPSEPLPCPDVLPKCINTWLTLVPNCKDNTDAACYCPSKDLVQQVFQCIYSNGNNDDDVAAAITFFQGVCAGYAGSNPAVATGAAPITSIITVTGTPYAAPSQYTTVVVETTVTEPCVSEGTTVPGSSTTVYVSTAITVPQVSITAAPVTAVPTYVAPVETAPASEPTQVVPPVAAPPAPIGTATGTGAFPGSTGFPVVGAAGRVGAGMSLGLAVMAAVFAL